MSNIENGRLAVKEYMKSNGITPADMATAYGYTRERMQQILDGHWSGPKANQTIIEIIRDYRIRPDKTKKEERKSEHKRVSTN